MLMIQANIFGFSGKPCSVFGVYDEKDEILLIAKFTDLKERQKDCLLISSDKHAPYDSYFDPEKLSQGITSYQYLKSKKASDGVSQCLVFGANARNADPSSYIQLDSVDDSGMKYRVSMDATNCAIATLAMCKYVESTFAINDALNMMDELNAFIGGEVITI